MNIQSDTCNLVVVNVHFEPDLTQRSPHERLRRVTPHWPQTPEALGVITGDFNICEPKEGRFNSSNQNFTDGDAVKAALFRSFVPHVLEIAQPDFTRKDSAADGTLHTLSRIDKAFINVPLAEAGNFHCLRTLVNGPFRVTTQPYASFFKNRQFGTTKTNAFRVGCPNIPFSAQF